MRRSRLCLALLALWAASCSAKTTKVDATEVVARIDAESSVLSSLSSLRVRTASEQDGAWVNVDTKSFDASALIWPVDIVLTPLSQAHADGFFEIVVDALDAQGEVLVQTRGLSAFDPHRARVLPLSLSTCGDKPLRFVCQDESTGDCYGPNCLTCVDATCATTPMVVASTLPPLDGGPPAHDDARVADAAHDDASIRDATAHDASTPDASGDGGPVQTVCMTGYEPDGRGGCQDVDECAAHTSDCDDDPDACVNELGSFRCTCPSGYSGDGKGSDGCTDIDECSTHSAQCDSTAKCTNTTGSYTCGTCDPGYTGGAGGACVDVDECATNNGGCSPNAACGNPLGAPNTCTCNSGYAGNGQGANGCTDINECATNNGGCNANAACTNQVGAAPTCKCNSGYSGTGVGTAGCTNINDCAPNPCQNGGTCTDGLNAHSCACNASSTGPNCEYQVCATTTVNTASVLAGLKNCGIIMGDLNIQAGMSAVNPSDLPYLTTITGNFTVTEFGAQTAGPSTVNLTALTTVGGNVTLGGSNDLKVVLLPGLTTAGTPGATSLFQIDESAIGRVEMPALTTIYGNAEIGLNSQLCAANFQRLSNITGNLDMQMAPNIPYSQLAPFVNATKGTKMIADIGCCTVIDMMSCNANDGVTCDPVVCP